MDIAVYIKELLGLHGELNIPGLGYFGSVRVNGYYNEDEGRLYPPGYKAQLDLQSIDADETLAEYIASKKNISAASSKYFVDKYISNLKQQAQTEEVQMADLGWLHTIDGQLAFKPNEKGFVADEAFFGLQPVAINKLSDGRYNEPPASYSTKPEEDDQNLQLTDNEPETEEQFSEPVFEDKQPVTVAEEQPTSVSIKKTDDAGNFPDVLNIKEDDSGFDDEAENRPVNIWVILLSIITVAMLALMALYKFQPALFDKLTPWRHHSNEVKPLTKPDLNADTSLYSEPVIREDTPAKTTDTPIAGTPVIDTQVTTVTPQAKPKAVTTQVQQSPAPAAVAAKPTAEGMVTSQSIADGSFIIIGGAFAKLSEAKTAVANYKNKGFAQVQMLDKAKKGKYYKILFGVYKTRAEAGKAQDELLKTGKIKPGETIIQPHKTKK